MRRGVVRRTNLDVVTLLDSTKVDTAGNSADVIKSRILSRAVEAFNVCSIQVGGRRTVHSCHMFAHDCSFCVQIRDAGLLKVLLLGAVELVGSADWLVVDVQRRPGATVVSVANGCEQATFDR